MVNDEDYTVQGSDTIQTLALIGNYVLDELAVFIFRTNMETTCSSKTDNRVPNYTDSDPRRE
jgi:hypothetical protein